MNMQGFVDWVETSDIGVYVHYFRTLDTLLKSEPSGATSLLVSYLRFSDKCVEFAVSSIGVELGKDGPVYDAQGWRDIFVAKPCVALPPKAQTFEGLESGGRLIQRGPNRLLISIGQFGFDGQLMTPAVSMDPSVDLGKILELDTDTGKASIVSMGHRNPQGLALDSDGHVWATEHGPNGGDELNLIVEGRNYGWPQTTYALLSRNRRAEWPTNSVQGRHDTVYELPRFFFSPSIGVSNLIEVKGDEFPRWRGDLLVGSLVDATLYRIRREGNRIVSVERIAISERIRDIILMRDHRVALLTDNGDIKILQQTQASLEPRQPLPDMRIAGFADIAAARSKDPLLGRQLTFHEQGRRLYVTNCASCHSLNGSAG
jgi:hypothetical protein